MMNKLNEVLKNLKLIFKNSVKNILKGELFVTSDGYLTNKRVVIKKEFVKGLDSSVDAGFAVNNLTRGTYEKGMKLIDLEAKKEFSKLVFELITEYDGKKSVHIINKYVHTECLFMILANKLNVKIYSCFVLGVNDNDDIVMLVPCADGGRFEEYFENDVELDVVINEITEAKKQKEIELQKQKELVDKLVYENFKYHTKNSDGYLNTLENDVVGNKLKIVSPVKNFTSSYNVAVYDNGSWKTIFSTIMLSSYSKTITKKVCNKSIEILQDKNLFNKLKETILNEIKEENKMNNIKKDVKNETEKQLEDRLNREFEEYLDACILTEIEYVNENNVIVDSELSLSIYLDYINSNEAVEEYYPVEVIASEYDTIIDYDIFSDYAICKVDVVGTEVVECIKNIFTVNDKTTNNNGIGYVPSKEGVKVVNDKFYIPINNYELALEEYNSIVNKYHELLLKFKTQDIIIQNVYEVLNPLDRYKDDRIIKEKTQPIIDYFKMQGYNLNNCIEYNPTYDRYIFNIDELINQILNNYEIRYLNDMQILHSVLKDNVLIYNKSGFKEYIILSIQKMFKKYKLLNFNSKQFEISNTT